MAHGPHLVLNLLVIDSQTLFEFDLQEDLNFELGKCFQQLLLVQGREVSSVDSLLRKFIRDLAEGLPECFDVVGYLFNRPADQPLGLCGFHRSRG